jgi:hypothetical protein
VRLAPQLHPIVVRHDGCGGVLWVGGEVSLHGADDPVVVAVGAHPCREVLGPQGVAEDGQRDTGADLLVPHLPNVLDGPLRPLGQTEIALLVVKLVDDLKAGDQVHPLDPADGQPVDLRQGLEVLESGKTVQVSTTTAHPLFPEA